MSPTSTQTPTITPGGPPVCIFGTGTSAVIASRTFVLNAPLSGSQIWRFGALQPDSSRPITILPNESHFDCAATNVLGQSLRICTRLDPATPASGAIDCTPSGGSITAYDSLTQVDHNTNSATVGGKPNLGLPAHCVGGSHDGAVCGTSDAAADCPGGTCQPQTGAADPSCAATFTAEDGSVSDSCVEGQGAGCSTQFNTHLGTCNSPTEQTLFGSTPAGGVRFRETIDLEIYYGTCSDLFCRCAVGTCIGGTTPGAQCGYFNDCGGDATCLTNNFASCTTDADCYGSVHNGVCGVCPPDSCPLQSGEYQLSGVVTSGASKAVVWSANDTALTIGTVGAGNGANICGQLVGGPTCPTIATGTPVDLTALGGDCLATAPTTVSGASVGVAFPSLGDLNAAVGDFVANVKLQCQ